MPNRLAVLTHLGQQEEHPVTELHGAVEKDAGKDSLHQGMANLTTALKIHQLHGTKATTRTCVKVNKLDICHVELVIGKVRYKVEVLTRVLEHIKYGLKVQRRKLAQADFSPSPPTCVPQH